MMSQQEGSWFILVTVFVGVGECVCMRAAMCVLVHACMYDCVRLREK